jgi:hypothetical protein
LYGVEATQAFYTVNCDDAKNVNKVVRLLHENADLVCLFNPDSALDFVMRENMISSEGREGIKNENPSKYEVRFFRNKLIMRIPGLTFVSSKLYYNWIIFIGFSDL